MVGVLVESCSILCVHFVGAVAALFYDKLGCSVGVPLFCYSLVHISSSGEHLLAKATLLTGQWSSTIVKFLGKM